MIRYALRCDRGAPLRLLVRVERGLRPPDRRRACSPARSAAASAVEKDLMAPSVARRRRRSRRCPAPASPAEQALAELRRRDRGAVRGRRPRLRRRGAAHPRGRRARARDHRRGPPVRGPRADRGRHPGRAAALVVGAAQVELIGRQAPTVPSPGWRVGGRALDCGNARHRLHRLGGARRAPRDRVLVPRRSATGRCARHRRTGRSWSRRAGGGPQLAISIVSSDAASHQRHHLDLYASDAAAEIERLLGLGARRVDWRYPSDADYVVLADPDGNTFCVVEKPEAPAGGA